MNTLKSKLRARRGMTLTEVITAVLILSLVAAGMAAGVSASLRIYRQSVTLSDAQTLTSTLSIALMDELRYAQNPHSENDTAVFTSSTFGENVSVGNANGHVTINGMELIGSGAYNGLTADANVDYYDGLFDVTLKVCLADENSQAIQNAQFFVSPLNG